jgi:hypothetical protein
MNCLMRFSPRNGPGSVLASATPVRPRRRRIHSPCAGEKLKRTSSVHPDKPIFGTLQVFFACGPFLVTRSLDDSA